MSDDARDLGLVRQGQGAAAHEAFARLYDRHAAVVRALCRSKLADDTEADDALQETFIRAYSMVDRVHDGAGVRSWLYAIARNVCSERKRSSRRRRSHEHAAAGLRLTGSSHMTPASLQSSSAATQRGNDGGGAGAALAPEASAGRSEELERLSRALEKLPEDERLAVHLYYLEADPVTTAADCLGVSRSGFYKLLTRARERLASLMTRADT